MAASTFCPLLLGLLFWEQVLSAIEETDWKIYVKRVGALEMKIYNGSDGMQKYVLHWPGTYYVTD